MSPFRLRAYAGKQVRLYLYVMGYMAAQSRFMVENGGIPFDDPVWEKLREKAELSKKTAGKVKPFYVKPTGGLWPMLERLPSGLYAVKDENILPFLERQGHIRVKAGLAGEASAKKRTGQKTPDK